MAPGVRDWIDKYSSRQVSRILPVDIRADMISRAAHIRLPVWLSIFFSGAIKSKSSLLSFIDCLVVDKAELGVSRGGSHDDCMDGSRIVPTFSSSYSNDAFFSCALHFFAFVPSRSLLFHLRNITSRAQMISVFWLLSLH